MIRIWAKTIVEEKVQKSIIYENSENFTPENFQQYLEDICAKLDIPVPVYLTKHIRHYVNFNNTFFVESDFVESIDFDKFVLEEASNY